MKTMKTENTNANTNLVAWNTILDLVSTASNDSVRIEESANNYNLGTWKLKIDVVTSLGKDQKELRLDTKLPVFIRKEFDKDEGGNTVTHTINFTVAHLLLIASNGLFELLNNKKKDGYDKLITALENGYFFAQTYQNSLKAPPFSWADFSIWLKVQELPADIQPKVDKFLALTTKQMSSLTHEQLEQITWLYPLITAKGYTKPTAASNSLLDDLI